LMALSEYGVEQMAFFATRDIQIWLVDPDPSRNRIRQVLRGTGTFAPRSVLPWGNDVVYLDRPGIRNLQPRDSSNAAWLNYIGAPVDPLVRYVVTAAGPAMAERAITAVDPDDGRLMVAINQ